MITGILRVFQSLQWPLRQWWPIIAIVAAALIPQALSALDCDVSWLIAIAERLLGGARLHRDLDEVNPPASALLHVPPVAIGHLLGVRPEVLTAMMVSALALLSLRHASRILSRPPACTALGAACAFLLLVLPADLFAQREHVAFIASLPMLAVIVMRSRALPIPVADAEAAGVAAGIARHRAKVVLVDDAPGPQWIAAHPPLTHAMRRYRPAARVGHVTVDATRPL